MNDFDADVVDLVALGEAAERQGAIWTRTSVDLNVNLMVLPAHGEIAEHTNSEVDVLLVGIQGEGVLVIAGEPRRVSGGQVTVIPKGVPRSIRCADQQFAYLTCHRRRAGLWPGPPASR